MAATQTAIDIKQSSVHAEDIAAKEIVGQINHESMKLAFFGDQINAQWAADRFLKLKSTPPLQGELVCNRNVFDLQVGDAFVLNLTDQNLSDTVFRVLHIREEDIESENIILTIAQDVDYVASDIILPEVIKYAPARDYSIVDLTDFTFFEAPYAILGEEMRLIPLASRVKGTELGYELHMSVDGGLSYFFLDDITQFAVHGTLATSLDKNINTLSKTFHLPVDFDLNADALGIDTLTRTNMFSGKNYAVITDGTNHEIVNFQTIVPDDSIASRYIISDLWRSRYDTPKRTWQNGVDFYFIGEGFTLLQNENFLVGTTRYFKVVPYNSKFFGSIDTANPASYTFVGRVYKPYQPVNLRANGVAQLATFATQVVLTWSPRVRGYDAGINDPDTVVDAAPTHEGYFRVDCYLGTSSSIASTTDNISSYGVTFTNANIKSWNGGTLSGIDTLVFKVYNWKTSASVNFDSEVNTIQVRKV